MIGWMDDVAPAETPVVENGIEQGGALCYGGLLIAIAHLSREVMKQGRTRED